MKEDFRTYLLMDIMSQEYLNFAKNPNNIDNNHESNNHNSMSLLDFYLFQANNASNL